MCRLYLNNFPLQSYKKDCINLFFLHSYNISSPNVCEAASDDTCTCIYKQSFIIYSYFHTVINCIHLFFLHIYYISSPNICKAAIDDTKTELHCLFFLSYIYQLISAEHQRYKNELQSLNSLSCNVDCIHCVAPTKG